MGKRRREKGLSADRELLLSFFACPNAECADFNRFDAGNLPAGKLRNAGIKGLADNKPYRAKSKNMEPAAILAD